MKLQDYLPPMYEGEELLNKLAVYPEYDGSICNATIAERLVGLSDLYSLYIPTDMSVEIYYKFYLALLHSLEQKNTMTATKQLYENYKGIKGQQYKGIMGGIDAFVITGNSGVGKSSAISRAISVITDNNNVVEIKSPSYRKILPFLVVQTPFDCSLKSLLLEILRKVDECLETNYYFNAIRIRATTDVLIGMVSTVSLNHIGVLVIDEIQNVVNSKNGRYLVGSITQLINNAGISIVFAGTPAIVPFLEADFMLARRMMNLQYSPLSYDKKFLDICNTLWKYQYVKAYPLTDEIVVWLYNHSKGIISVVISLIHDAQELAVFSDSGTLNIETLNIAYRQRLNLLNGYLAPQERHYSNTKKDNVSAFHDKDLSDTNDRLIFDIVSYAKATGKDILNLLKQHFSIDEVSV